MLALTTTLLIAFVRRICPNPFLALGLLGPIGPHGMLPV
jgi:hypothetical protein